MSQLSQCSTVPEELADSSDILFVEELNELDRLYFIGHQTENHQEHKSDPCCECATNFESDSDSLGENDWVDIDVEPSLLDN